MNSAASPAPALSRLQVEKRAAITSAARRVFGRDGYARASIDAIATEAGVSTRTIYKHFGNKEHLFISVLETSANEVADGFVARLDALSTGDAEQELIGLGLAILSQADDNPEHFAMVRQITAEAAHFPPTALTTWRKAGPERVEGAITDRLRSMAARGLLDVTDPHRAALHLMALSTAERRHQLFYGADSRAPEAIMASITAAVATFLHGHAPH